MQQEAVLTGALFSGACEAAGEWQYVLLLLEDLTAMTLTPDSRTCASVLCSCVRSEKWSHALSNWNHFARGRLEPDMVAWDSVISACASTEVGSLGCFFLLESAPIRRPLQFLWALAELGISDPLVIEGACREVCHNLTSRWAAEDVATFFWSTATLGASCPAASRAIARRLGSVSQSGV